MDVVMIAIVTTAMTDVTTETIDARIMIIAVRLVMHDQGAMIDQALIVRIEQTVLMYNALIVRQAVIRGGMSVILDAPTLVIAQVGDLMMTRVNSL